MVTVDVYTEIPEELKFFIDSKLAIYGYEHISRLMQQLLREWAMKVKQLEHKG